ncbi:hypothetical protein PQQ99_08930 [Paraburkholderia sediminicola]|uniref:hypothetical protein n=1 Tax=Paraburkholderia sediminicola TaxID=458836 RepID=UPI0038B890F2
MAAQSMEDVVAALRTRKYREIWLGAEQRVAAGPLGFRHGVARMLELHLEERSPMNEGR